ncbi:MAG TPA: LysR family transcriptional regulator [Verrucomicrobiae bacterium]|nr:LysR family transcriptional regulator [Verrucomicrobiae bacterium]
MKRFNREDELNSQSREPLDSRQLKAFALLAQTGSYTETARRLYVTHSAVSHAMRALESSLGCRLLNRVDKRVVLTEAGEALLPHAEKALTEMERARETISALNKWGYRRLRLAAETALGPFFLHSVLVKYQREFPRVMMNIEFLNGQETRAALEVNRVELALTERPPQDERFEFVRLFSDRLQVVVSAGHPWAAKGAISRPELPKNPFILYRASKESRRMQEDYFAKDGVVLNMVAELDHPDAVKELVKHTGAMSILPQWTFAREKQEGSLAALSPGRKMMEQTWGFTHWRGRALDNAEATFVKACREGLAGAGY